MTRIDIKEQMMTNPGVTVAVLDAIYQFQTFDEQAMNGTIHQNGQGFNGVDGPICSDMLTFYKRCGTLSARQLDFLKRCLPKYLGQLEGLNLQPLPFKVYGSQHNNPNAVASKPVETAMKAVLDGKWITLSFPYNPDTIAKVKTLTDRSWDPEKKQWYAVLCLDTAEKLIEWGFNVDDKIKEFVKRFKNQTVKKLDTSALRKSLFPYQVQGVEFIEARKGRALVGDEMGLGKTCQALSWLHLHPEALPAVIVAPASLKLNWKREIEMWTDIKSVQIVEGRRPYKLKADVVIINYDVLQAWLETIIEHEPKTIIADECHYFKSNDAQRTKAVKSLAKKVDHFIALSGTPIVNRPVEMFNAINCVEPALFPSFFKYAQRYCGATNNGYGWDFNGATNTKELHDKLAETIMIRRKKEDVLKDLPPKMKIVVPIELSNAGEYARAENDFISWMKDAFGTKAAVAAMNAEALVRIERLKQLAVEGKIDECLNWIDDFISNDQKLVVFTTHTNILNLIVDKFKNISVKVDGSVSGTDRQKAVDAFQTDDNIRLFIGNIKAAGVGLTLTAASSTCFIELDWTPGSHEQAEARVHRIGQEAESVSAYYLLAYGTIETEIAALLDKKQQVLSQVLDGEDASEKALLTELLNKYKGE